MEVGYPPGMAKHPKRPRDPNQLAKAIVDLATGETSDKPTVHQARARKAGAIGGPARAKALTPEQRAEIARVAASARWKKGG
jgi:hypothetical protein